MNFNRQTPKWIQVLNLPSKVAQWYLQAAHTVDGIIPKRKLNNSSRTIPFYTGFQIAARSPSRGANQGFGGMPPIQQVPHAEFSNISPAHSPTHRKVNLA
jgi:hypothetical protein